MLKELRRNYKPVIPRILSSVVFEQKDCLPVKDEIRKLFPKTSDQSVVLGKEGRATPLPPLKIGAVFSGGPAPGGHNVLAGILDAGCELFGFLDGPSGLIDGRRLELTNKKLGPYRNVGGFDLIGTGRTKIETQDQLQAILKAVQDLDGLVIIGGDDSNTNAAVIAEYFLQHGSVTKVIGVPKTIDGDLQNPYVAIPFGFDTATKIYSELIGNIAADALSAKKQTHFIKLMGRSASHITLECSLKTHPNLTLISEERKTLSQITSTIADLIEMRSAHQKNYGVILIPEGIVENMQLQTNFEKDPHGNINLSGFETEQLLINTVTEELKKRNFSGPFKPIAHFLGYEGRCGFPSNFDANYTYALGQVATLLIAHGFTSLMAFVTNLTHPASEWRVGGVPLTSQMQLLKKPVIAKTYVDLKGKPYRELQQNAAAWAIQDDYQSPGPIQFWGDPRITDTFPHILQ